MSPIAAGDQLAAYHARLRGPHDFDITVEVLTLDEQVTGTATFLDGQVNLLRKESGQFVRRECSLTLSDPAGALDFSDSSSWHGTGIWLDRLVRVRHHIDVPPYGIMSNTVFIGPPRQPSRSGAEVTVALQDKAALASRGALSHTEHRGANAVSAIKRILQVCTGEFRFRFPSSTRKLSQSYTVGLSDEASPIAVAYSIAYHELGWQLLYSCDGYALLRNTPSLSSPVADIGYVVDQASTSSDFTTAVNYVDVRGHVKSKTKGAVTKTTQPETIATLKDSDFLSPYRLRRKGVRRRLPLVITEDKYTKTTQTKKRAKDELSRGAAVSPETSASVVPMFHLDSDDVVRVHTDGLATRNMRLAEGSIPLGVGGPMTIGFQRKVSSTRIAKPKSRIIRTRKVRHKHKKKH